ncbi:3feb5923-b328-483c-9e48-f1efe8d5c385 [Sclerotinia trifoliorum]|uniref:ubiquitinyl hydrolase 1 n=1 Tax=Sclerotinia trifoliorum TaxID=28548 RepID=A0A8H2VSK4_9HELO|nr:3feb5923-b328-483c-9e48-f1efe8d5c385 [Sclerotinia trifoliorum]
MATKVVKMYRAPPFLTFDSSNSTGYNHTEAFKYNPRSFLMKNPKQNKLYAQYFAPSKIYRRRFSRGRKMSSPARSASSSSSSSSTNGSKSSVSPPPPKSSDYYPSTKSTPRSRMSISPSAKSSLSPPPSNPSVSSSPEETVDTTAQLIASNSPPPSDLSAPTPHLENSVCPSLEKKSDNISSFVSCASPDLPLSSLPSSVVPAPSKSPGLSSPSVAIKDEITTKPNSPNEALPETKSNKIKIKFVEPSKFYSAKDENSTTTCSSLKRSRSDDENDETASQRESPKKRRLNPKASKVPIQTAVTSKPSAKPSKEELEKIRSDSLKKRRYLASKVRKDSSRMPTAAQRGLANVTGYACYRNSLLQGLFHLPKFFNFLIDQHPVDTCDIPKKDCLACALCHLSSKYWTVGFPAKEITIMLRRLEVQCKRLGWYPGPSGQGDPHEQITWMLEKIDKQMKASSVASMQSIMQLVLSSRITCDKCHNVSVGDLQDELALSVPLKPRIRGGSLSSYLHKYLDETIEGYRCEKCKKVGDVHRVQLISHAPDILFVQLKRFGYDGRKDKLTLPIDHTLDLSAYRDPNGSKDSMEYELVASVSHSGSLDYGHYTCDARGPDGRWNCFNDAYYDATTMAKALGSNQPYLLFYQRKRT